jgi:hypothetical protein
VTVAASTIPFISLKEEEVGTAAAAEIGANTPVTRSKFPVPQSHKCWWPAATVLWKIGPVSQILFRDKFDFIFQRFSTSRSNSTLVCKKIGLVILWIHKPWRQQPLITNPFP